MEFSSEEYLKKRFTLKWLAKRERQLNIAICYEKLRRSEPVTLDKDVLRERIAELETSLQKVLHEYKMNYVMHSNLLLAKTLQNIEKRSPKRGSSNSQKSYIIDLLTKKNDLSKKIAAEQQEIASIEVVMLKQRKINLKRVENERGAAARDTLQEDKYKELERLERSNEQITGRVKLLAKVIQSLVTHSLENKDGNLSALLIGCETILTSRVDDLESVDTLLKNVCSVNL